MSFWTRDARAFAEALFSGPSGPPPSDRLDWLMDDLADFFEQSGPRVLAIFVGGVTAASIVAPALIGKLPPLRRLSIEDRWRALDRMEETPFGLPLLAVKAILCILYYEHPGSLRDIGVTQGDETSMSCLINPGSLTAGRAKHAATS